MTIARIVSGGQTGADRGGLAAAIHCRLPHGGWCPKGRRSEDGTIPDKYRLKESPSRNYEARTEANVVDSDATIIFTYGELEGGSLKTALFAKKHNKPFLHVDLGRLPRKEGVDTVVQWLLEKCPAECILNVAGSRASKAPGIAGAVMAWMVDVICKANRALFYPIEPGDFSDYDGEGHGFDDLDPADIERIGESTREPIQDIAACHPRTIAEAVEIVLRHQTPTGRETIRKYSDRGDFVYDALFGMGTWIRNAMIHRNDNIIDLMADFQRGVKNGLWEDGKAEADHVSRVITGLVWDRIKEEQQAMSYRQSTLERLGRYRVENLKVTEQGRWPKENGKEYGHILPDDPGMEKLNILKPFRDDFWKYFESLTPRIKLHRDFAHLNSSQAMCFNLFFPLLHEKAYGVLLEVLKIKGEVDVDVQCSFEKILKKKEYTNFDFYIRLLSGRQLLFEVKFTEQDFGTRNPSEKAKAKAEEIYRPRLQGKVPDKYLVDDQLFSHYQILRNMSYLDVESSDRLFFVYPFANDHLHSHSKAIKDIGSRGLSECFEIVDLKELVEGIRKAVRGRGRLEDHYAEFALKYLGMEK